MMLPKKTLNIYPKTEENINALLHFYFDEFNLPWEDSVEKIITHSNLSLNQIEFIVRKLSESWILIFKDFFYNKTSTVSNLLAYGIEALTKDKKDWTTKETSPRGKKTLEFLIFVKQTETDFNFLETNN